MTERDFVYWLQGFAELNAEPPTAEQWKSIREHLATVFVKVTPPFQASPSAPVSDRTYVPTPVYQPRITPFDSKEWPFGGIQITC